MKSDEYPKLVQLIAFEERLINLYSYASSVCKRKDLKMQVVNFSQDHCSHKEILSDIISGNTMQTRFCESGSVETVSEGFRFDAASFLGMCLRYEETNYSRYQEILCSGISESKELEQIADDEEDHISYIRDMLYIVTRTEESFLPKAIFQNINFGRLNFLRMLD